MAGLNKMELARKAFKEFNGHIYGAEVLKNIVRTRLTSDENKVLSYLKTMRAVGILREEKPFKFRIDITANEIPETDEFNEVKI